MAIKTERGKIIGTGHCDCGSDLVCIEEGERGRELTCRRHPYTAGHADSRRETESASVLPGRVPALRHVVA